MLSARAATNPNRHVSLVHKWIDCGVDGWVGTWMEDFVDVQCRFAHVWIDCGVGGYLGGGS